MTAGPAAADRLGALAASGWAAQWRADDIDWSVEARPPRWLPARTFVGLVSQILHGEQATIEMCRTLRPVLADEAARACLDVQMVDERRHADAYRRYLDRLGGAGPMDATLAAALEDAGATGLGADAAVVAYHVILESEALDVQRIVMRWVPCPLLSTIAARVARDEARHIAFGRTFLTGRLDRLPRDERIALYRRVKPLWLECTRSTLARLDGLGPFQRGMAGRRLIAERWQRQARTLVAIGLVSEAEMALADR